MPLILTIFVVHVSNFSPSLSVFAPLHVYPVAAALPPPCWNWLLFSAKVIKTYLFLPFIPPSKISVQHVLNYYGNIPPAGCQISHLHVFARCVCVSSLLCVSCRTPFHHISSVLLACTLSETCPRCFHPADPRDVIVHIHFGGKITQSSCNLRRRLSLDECFSPVGHFFQSSWQPGERMGNMSGAAACFPVCV